MIEAMGAARLKKGCLVYYRWQEGWTPNKTRNFKNKSGLCCEAYDPETKKPGTILFEDCELVEFKPSEDTRHHWLEVIDD
tara:strand:- start:291 stop:530 length:240 start_codon:yes stop_codon:yes gene_type:complete